MAIWSKLGLSGPAAGAGAAVVVVLGIGGYLAFTSVPQDPEPLAQAPIPATPEVTAAPEPVSSPAPTPAPEASDVVEATQDPVPENPIEAATPPRPSFDLVQVDAGGNGVIAGRAVPGRPVIFYLDGQEFSRGKADGAGKFGVVLDFPASDAPRSLSVASVLENGDALASDGTLLISPVRSNPTPKVEPAPEAVAEAAPENEPQPTSETDTQQDVAQAPAAPTAPDIPDAPAIVLATNDSVKLIQPAPQPAAPQIDNSPVTANVVIDTITYDASGDVALAGRGASTGFVRVYLNDEPIKTSQIAEDGSWQAPLPNVDAGVYRLRVDEVDTGGTVTSRIETPFQREEPDVVAAAPSGPQAITVQPGFTLWAIARDSFGSGEQYVRVYEANRDLIRDPDLIYPGQVFALPEG